MVGITEAILVTGFNPRQCIRSYCKYVGLKSAYIVNRLEITEDTKHLADHAVKFSAISKEDDIERIYIAYFKFAQIAGIYLTRVTEIKI